MEVQVGGDYDNVDSVRMLPRWYHVASCWPNSLAQAEPSAKHKTSERPRSVCSLPFSLYSIFAHRYLSPNVKNMDNIRLVDTWQYDTHFFALSSEVSSKLISCGLSCN